MSIFNGLQINASGLALERLKLDTVSTNIANLNTNQPKNSAAYHAKSVVFSESMKTSLNNGPTSSGVKVIGIDENLDRNLKYDPTNEAADANGYVEQSNVNLSDEMVNMIQAMRTYEANVSAQEANKSILTKALAISKN